MPLRALRERRGQASLEYVAALAVVGLLLGTGVALGAVPGVGGRVAHTVRLGICLVAGDVCRVADARAAGLEPCTVAQAVRGGGATLTVASIRFGAHDEYTAARRSDGSVVVTRAQDGSTGIEAGLGFEFSPAKVRVGADATLDVRGTRATGWTFPSPAVARAFIAGLPDSAGDEHRWPRAWRSYGIGDEAEAAVTASALGHDLAGATAAAEAGAGVRTARDGSPTLLLDAGYHGLTAFAPLAGSSGGGSGHVYAEWTPGRELRFRSASLAAGGRLVEWSAALDLRDPANRAAAAPLLEAKAPWPPAAIRQVEAVLAQARRTGVVERTVSAVQDDSHDFSAGAKLGLALGLDVRSSHVDQHLMAASAWTGGSGERERADCLGG
jgi:hypothetical protein